MQSYHSLRVAADDSNIRPRTRLLFKLYVTTNDLRNSSESLFLAPNPKSETTCRYATQNHEKI